MPSTACQKKKMIKKIPTKNNPPKTQEKEEQRFYVCLINAAGSQKRQ